MHEILQENRHYRLYQAMIEQVDNWEITQLKMLLFDSKMFMTENEKLKSLKEFGNTCTNFLTKSKNGRSQTHPKFKQACLSLYLHFLKEDRLE